MRNAPVGSKKDSLLCEAREPQILSGKQMRRERRGHTFQKTALVSEAYIRLVGGKPGN
ncbi:MAG: ECF-type sigma factor [Planctomycetota bacterium]